MHPPSNRTLLVGAANEMSDPMGSTTSFLLRASARLDTRQPVLMTYIIYFTKFHNALRARGSAAKAGWPAALSAVPGAYVVRLTRRRLLADGQLNDERRQVLQLTSLYDGRWRYVLLEEQQAVGTTWERLAQQIEAAPSGQPSADPALPATTGAASRRPPTREAG